MDDKLPLDLTRLTVGTAGWQALLFGLTVVQMAFGMALIIGAILAAVFATPLALPAMVLAVSVASAHAAQLTILAAVFVLLIPLGALVAARLKLKQTEDFIFVHSGAQVLNPNTALGREFTRMATAAGLTEIPRYGLMDDVENAYALGGYEHVGLVLLGRKLIRRLEPPALLAVLGHEIGHIAMLDSKRRQLAIGHQDFLVAFLAANGAKRFGRRCLILFSELIFAAHSRHREYWADAVGAYVTSKEDMISALKSLAGADRVPTPLERHFSAIMFIPATSPLFSTHPTFEQRIEALEAETFLSRLPVSSAPVPDAVEPAPEQAEPRFGGI